MNKEVFLIFLVLSILSVGVFAQESNDKGKIEDFVENFIKDKEIIKGAEILDIVEINQTDLPDDLEIKNIEENKIGIYEINYTQNNESKKIFVVTYATNNFAKKEDVNKIIKDIYFGYSGISSESGFLKSSVGVLSGNNKGYVMLRSGSITGISTSLDLEGDGKVYISVYKNGEDTGFHNLISSDDKKRIDYDLQSENIVTYSPGDVISVYIQRSGNVEWGEVVTSVETTS